MFQVTVYYKTCPDCGKKWATQLSPNQQVIRLGKEAFICKCKKAGGPGF